ncbi:galactose-specific lectin nattectin-like isoform X1 [Xiphophorus hellerii]|uniref:galactose-specific lectin nattectin-like isoform X1 n=1 Tax=Xiphophorus hellerii TaxID=8084 RepID=UPI0013B3732E|nr:galactose-specific lectin nattectin-like isoform X1 [Xiphophorus hellerii]
MASGFQLVLILGFIMMTAEAGPVPNMAAACPPGWTQFGSRCFIFYYNMRTWSDAEEFCISIGGNLASIHNNEENSFLSDMVVRDTGSPAITWVGGYDAITEGQWLWSDGSKFDYTSFAIGEPDNIQQSEHCLEMNYIVYKWNDRSCNQPWPFICAKKI